MLARAADSLGWERDAVRVLDIAAGNGVSGEALAAAGLRPVLGTDIVALGPRGGAPRPPRPLRPVPDARPAGADRR